jgi:hypothetical protein
MSDVASFGMKHKQAKKRGRDHVYPVSYCFELNARLLEKTSKRINNGLTDCICESIQPARGANPKII